MNWFKARRLAKLKVQFAGVLAADRCERELSNKTGRCFPAILAGNAKRIGELEEAIRQLEEAPLPVIDESLLGEGK